MAISKVYLIVSFIYSCIIHFYIRWLMHWKRLGYFCLLSVSLCNLYLSNGRQHTGSHACLPPRWPAVRDPLGDEGLFDDWILSLPFCTSVCGDASPALQSVFWGDIWTWSVSAGVKLMATALALARQFWTWRMGDAMCSGAGLTIPYAPVLPC